MWQPSNIVLVVRTLMQFRYPVGGRSSSSPLFEIPKKHKIDPLLSGMSSFVSVVGVYVGIRNRIFN
jgi:hypothetical protein